MLYIINTLNISEPCFVTFKCSPYECIELVRKIYTNCAWRAEMWNALGKGGARDMRERASEIG